MPMTVLAWLVHATGLQGCFVDISLRHHVLLYMKSQHPL